MNDTCSMANSVYWDSSSVVSDSTYCADSFETPAGSFMDLSIYAESYDCNTATNSGSVTPRQSACVNVSNAVEDPINICNEDSDEKVPTPLLMPVRPPPIKLRKSVSIQVDEISSVPEKTSQRSFSNSFRFPKISFRRSMSDDHRKSDNIRNIYLKMRNSIKQINIFEKRKSISTIFTKTKKAQPLKNDSGICSLDKTTQNGTNEVPGRNNESMFHIYSTLDSLLKSEPVSDSIPSILTECMNVFLDINKMQIEKGIDRLNRHLGQYFNLFSDNFTATNKTKKYLVQRLEGSKDICTITEVYSKERYIALKRSPDKNWISFTGFLQYSETDSEPCADQTWVCYEATTITNLSSEDNRPTVDTDGSKRILDSLIQLCSILHHKIDINSSEVTLVASSLSLIVVFNESTLSLEKDQSLEFNNSKALKYRDSLMDLCVVVERFLMRADNCVHFISASYPLDYLFFVLMKLHRHKDVIDTAR